MPTLINVKDENDPLMSEELFGPYLPILKEFGYSGSPSKILDDVSKKSPKKTKGEFKKGQNNRRAEKNGNKKRQGSYLDGMEQGVFTHWNEGGQKIEIKSIFFRVCKDDETFII